MDKPEEEIVVDHPLVVENPEPKARTSHKGGAHFRPEDVATEDAETMKLEDAETMQLKDHAEDVISDSSTETAPPQLTWEGDRLVTAETLPLFVRFSLWRICRKAQRRGTSPTLIVATIPQRFIESYPCASFAVAVRDWLSTELVMRKIDDKNNRFVVIAEYAGSRSLLSSFLDVHIDSWDARKANDELMRAENRQKDTPPLFLSTAVYPQTTIRLSRNGNTDKIYGSSHVIFVGRSENADLIIDGDDSVSRNHFSLCQDHQGGWHLDDLGSSGIKLNGINVHGGAANIEVGDVIDIGRHTTIRVEAIESYWKRLEA